MAVSSGSGTTRELDQTPTWAVAGVCLVIIIISIALEKILHKLGMWFTKRHKKALFEALEKVKAELMVLGFISLLLTFSQYYIARICIPYNIANTMLPCPARDKISVEGRRLLWFDHRVLAAGGYGTTCKAGKVPLITVNGLHQLHILIFFLAVFHVIYSAVTMALGRLKVHLAPGIKFNFQKYIKRSLEDDFKTIVGVRFGVLFLCSYITLPLYALVAQMGSHMKKSIFDQQTSKALKNWHKAAKKKQGKGGGKSPAHSSLGGSPPVASVSSTLPSPGEATLLQFKTTSHSTRSFSYKDHEPSDLKVDMPSTTNLVVKIDDDLGTETRATPHPGEGSRNEYVHPDDSPTSFQ
ncbi:hypothetical protein RHMOL_Rhmol08G0031200 [Rhododendron molle]|uniref:Uncharacterized protein n=1 Tax=Rhododendron molle TaxID=49168 RepID=A0ACC0MJV4_RHOML|nr:hypothetical protein RHMOL_Rhmol08G0031200 [Rhododendron molle]